MVKKLNEISARLAGQNPFTNVYGLARTTLAIGTILIFLFNSGDTLFYNLVSDQQLTTSGFFLKRFSLFIVLHDHLIFSRIIVVVLLSVVASGWRPRLTGILHWYISYSFYAASPIVDGGDQITSILTLLLIPITMMDKRKWHWSASIASSNETVQGFMNIFAHCIFFIIRLQVAIIYFHAGVAKLSVDEWINGTCTYYWFTHPQVGAPLWLLNTVYYLMANPFIVVLITWGTLVFEILLASTLLVKKGDYTWKALLALGLVFHFSIILIHGLISFFFAMAGSLILFIVPKNKQIVFGSKAFIDKQAREEVASDLSLNTFQTIN